MEELIRQAFMHVEVIGPHVADGHYDLVGPNGEIILPQVWETMIEPDWAITMHMWPLPEQPRGPPDGANIIDVNPHIVNPGSRRNRGNRGQIPPQTSGRRGPPPPPPPQWIGPQPTGHMGGHDLGGVADEVIIIDDGATMKSVKKKPKDTGGGVLTGLFGGGGRKQSGKGRSVVHLFPKIYGSLLSNIGPKKAELYDTCRVM
jgi:hypothetical protein